MADPAISLITLLAFTIVVGYAGALIFKKFKVPDILVLLIFGLAVGYAGVVETDLFRALAPILSPLTLLVVLLDSGMHMELRQVLGAFPRSISLGIFGLLFSMLAAIVVGVTLMGLELKVALLLGSVFGGTSSVTVLGILRGIPARAEVKSILSLETVFNDTLAILVSVALLGLILPSLAVESPFLMIGLAFVVGATVGLAYGLAWIAAMSRVKRIQFNYMLTLAVAMLVYATCEHLFVTGTGALAVLFFGLVIGNALSFSRVIRREYELPQRISLFHSEITFFMRSFFFVYLGLTATIQINYLIYGVAFAIALILFRILAVRVAMLRSKLNKSELNLVKIMGPKGLVAAALTQLMVSYGVPGAEIFQGIAFVVIFATTVFSAVGAVWVSRKTR
jgi:cell volume regulation protein A